jgi:hypothetical protein
MSSSGMLCLVALVKTDVSEGPSASIIRVTRIGELGTTLAVTSNRRTLRRNTHGVTSPEDDILHSHRRENLKSYMIGCTYTIYKASLSVQARYSRLCPLICNQGTTAV